MLCEPHTLRATAGRPTIHPPYLAGRSPPRCVGAGQHGEGAGRRGQQKDEAQPVAEAAALWQTCVCVW